MIESKFNNTRNRTDKSFESHRKDKRKERVFNFDDPFQS